MTGKYPEEKIVIIGAGIAGLMQLYYAVKAAEEKGIRLRATIYDKRNLEENTFANVAPSITISEGVAVLPLGEAFHHALATPFDQPGGIAVDIPETISSESAQRFIAAVAAASEKKMGEKDIDPMLQLGQLAAEAWEEMYQGADEELKKIFDQANYKSCVESTSDQTDLTGYRIDIIHDIDDPVPYAQHIIEENQSLGYQKSALLSPGEVMEMNPSLESFCRQHALDDNTWKPKTIALLRPGGCINASVFMPLLWDYLRKKMGTYINQAGVEKDCLRIKTKRHITQLLFEDYQEEELDLAAITGIGYQDLTEEKTKFNQKVPTHYTICPGRDTANTFDQFNLISPPAAKFAGASLKLKFLIPKFLIPIELLEKYHSPDFCTEYHTSGVVLACQAHTETVDEDYHLCSIAVAGTKAFYGDVDPGLEDDFAMNRNILQLNAINQLFPHYLSYLLEKNTLNQELTKEDLDFLVTGNIAKRWVGVRALFPDGQPTYGPIFSRPDEDKPSFQLINGDCLTGFGSAGCNTAAAAQLNLITCGKTALPSSQFLSPADIRNLIACGNSNRFHDAPPS